MRTLHLMLKRKWYDMIASGEKKEEYREMTSYWMNRFCENVTCNFNVATGEIKLQGEIKNFDTVCFHLGYSKTTMTFKIDYIEAGQGCPEWGAEPGKQYFVIKLGEWI